MNKSYRQGQILRLIRSRRILTQEQLSQELAEMGVTATQVTLSRDMRELGLVKTSEGYRQVESGHSGPGLDAVVPEFLWDVVAAQNLLVLKTSPGHASSVAIALDHEDWEDVVGTIAGDDTVLVITPDSGTAVEVRKRLMVLLEA